MIVDAEKTIPETQEKKSFFKASPRQEITKHKTTLDNYIKDVQRSINYVHDITDFGFILDNDMESWAPPSYEYTSTDPIPGYLPSTEASDHVDTPNNWERFDEDFEPGWEFLWKTFVSWS